MQRTNLELLPTRIIPLQKQIAQATELPSGAESYGVALNRWGQCQRTYLGNQELRAELEQRREENADLYDLGDLSDWAELQQPKRPIGFGEWISEPINFAVFCAVMLTLGLCAGFGGGN